jgi:hypothetical protein
MSMELLIRSLWVDLSSELASLGDDGMEVAEGEENALELGLFRAHLQGILVTIL